MLPESWPDAAPLDPTGTDWLRNTLTITGSTDAVGRFADAAKRPGIIPVTSTSGDARVY